jgi:hypothetical protein
MDVAHAFNSWDEAGDQQGQNVWVEQASLHARCCKAHPHAVQTVWRTSKFMIRVGWFAHSALPCITKQIMKTWYKIASNWYWYWYWYDVMWYDVMFQWCFSDAMWCDVMWCFNDVSFNYFNQKHMYILLPSASRLFHRLMKTKQIAICIYMTNHLTQDLHQRFLRILRVISFHVVLNACVASPWSWCCCSLVIPDSVHLALLSFLSFLVVFFCVECRLCLCSSVLVLNHLSCFWFFVRMLYLSMAFLGLLLLGCVFLYIVLVFLCCFIYC